MNLSEKDLAISSLFISTFTTNVSINYQTVWGYVYEVVNLLVLTIFSLFKYSWSINKEIVLS